MVKIELPEDVKYILETLNENGYSSYIVGGCVRDSIMGLEPKDWDITTNARPDKVREIFENEDILVVPTGEKYGTMTVVIDETNYEITTFRRESYIDGDGRRPTKLIFGNYIEEDLSRRDLTINALCYNELVGLVDLYNGVEDIKNKQIRFVGEAKERIKEDALRIMRAIRFAVRFNFDIDEETLKILRDNVNLLNRVSRERIRQELVQILSYPMEEKLYKEIKFIFQYVFRLNGISKLFYIKEEIKSNLDYRVKIAKILDTYFELYKSEEWLRDNKYSHDEIVTIINIIKMEKNKKLEYSDYDVRKLLSEYPYEDIRLYFYNNEEIWVKILRNLGNPYTLQQLKLNGWDLRILGYEGKEIGEILKYLLDEVLKDPELNNKETLLKLLKNHK